MPFDSNGTFNRLRSWASDAAAHINIRSDYHDTHDQDIAAGLSQVITKDGRTQPTADLPMNGKKLIHLGDPIAPTDAVTKSYVDNIRAFSTGLVISGADTNGYLAFTSTTGAQGLSFVGADLSWLARLATAAGPGTPPVPPATLNRLVLNTKPDGSGTDVVIVNDDGTLTTTGVITAPEHVGPVITAKAPAAGNAVIQMVSKDGAARAKLFTIGDTQTSMGLTVGAATYSFGEDGKFNSPGNVYAGDSYLQATNGDVSGTVWNAWGSKSAFTAINARIEARAQAWANNKVSVTQIQRVAITYAGNVPSAGGGWVSPGGTVIVGYNRSDGMNGQVFGLYYATLQIYDNINGWRNMGG